MRSKFRSSLAVALATAVTLTSFSLAPAQAAPQNTPKVTNASGVDLSARRRHYRGNNAAALALFGLIAGGIAVAAASNRYDDGYYYGGGPGYRGGYRGGYHGGYHGGSGRGFHGDGLHHHR